MDNITVKSCTCPKCLSTAVAVTERETEILCNNPDCENGFVIEWFSEPKPIVWKDSDDDVWKNSDDDLPF